MLHDEKRCRLLITWFHPPSATDEYLAQVHMAVSIWLSLHGHEYIAQIPMVMNILSSPLECRWISGRVHSVVADYLAQSTGLCISGSIHRATSIWLNSQGHGYLAKSTGPQVFGSVHRPMSTKLNLLDCRRLSLSVYWVRDEHLTQSTGLEMGIWQKTITMYWWKISSTSVMSDTFNQISLSMLMMTIEKLQKSHSVSLEIITKSQVWMNLSLSLSLSEISLTHPASNLLVTEIEKVKRKDEL